MTFIGPNRFVVNLPLNLLRSQLLEKPGLKIPGVVDQHVDVPEPFDGRSHRRLRRGQARYVQLHDEEVVSFADGVGQSFGVAAGCDDCVAGGERSLRDVDAHAAASPSDEPNALVSH